MKKEMQDDENKRNGKVQKASRNLKEMTQ